MKRFLALLLALTMLLSAAGCGGETSSPATESSESQPVASAPPAASASKPEAPEEEETETVTAVWTQAETDGFEETLVEQVGVIEKELEGLSGEELTNKLLSYANDMAGAVSVGYVPAELTAKAGAIAYIYPHPLLLNNYAGMLVTAGQLELAKQVYLMALEQTPNDAYLLVNLGEIYFTQGFIADAENCAKKALDTQDEFALGYQLMTSIHLEHGDYTLAIETMLKGTKDNWNEVCEAQFQALYSGIMELDPMKDDHPMNSLCMELLYEVIALDATGEKQAGFDTPQSQQRFDWSYPAGAKFAGDYYKEVLQKFANDAQDIEVDESLVERVTAEYEGKIQAAADAGNFGEVLRLTKEMQEKLSGVTAQVEQAQPAHLKNNEKYHVQTPEFTCIGLSASSYIQVEMPLQNAARKRTFDEQIEQNFLPDGALMPDYNYLLHNSLYQCGYAGVLDDNAWAEKYRARDTEYQPGKRQYYCLQLLQQYYDFQILKAYSRLDKAALKRTVSDIAHLHDTYAKRHEALYPYEKDGVPYTAVDMDLQTGQQNTVSIYPRETNIDPEVLYIFYQEYYNALAAQMDSLINVLRKHYEKELQPLLEEYWLKMDAALGYVYDAEMQQYYAKLRSWLTTRYARVLYDSAVTGGIGAPMMGLKDELDNAKEAYEEALAAEIEAMMEQIYAEQKRSMEALQQAIERYITEGPTRLQPYDKRDQYSPYIEASTPSFFGYSTGITAAGSELSFFLNSPYGEGRITFDPTQDGKMLQSTCLAYGGAGYNPDMDANKAITDTLKNLGVDTLEKAADMYKDNPMANRFGSGIKLGKMIPKLEGDTKTGQYVSRSLTTGQITDAGNFAKRTHSIGIGDVAISRQSLEMTPYNIVAPKKTQAHIKTSGKFLSLGGQVTSNY